MNPPQDIGARAYAARIAQRLSGPARMILGYQELIVEEARESGLDDPVDDLVRVLDAARALVALVDGLLDGSVSPPSDAGEEARLRHDLRTPMNAILGYSEMVLEEFADDLTPRMAEDVATVQRESRALLEGIDALVDFARADAVPEPEGQDRDIAAHLAATVARLDATREEAAGRLLVVDDEKANRDLLERRLRRDGHEVVAASSAREALEILRSREIDVALIDILMPEVNGIELLARMKADERLRDIPVLMVSGLKEDAAVLRCIEAGADDYLPKPVDVVLLRARISACLERRRWREREKRYLAQIEAEKSRADALLHAVLPEQVVRRLADGEQVIADRFDEATIIFADIVDFTAMAAQTSPTGLVERLGATFARFDDLAERHGVEKIKTIGDAYMAAAGVPEPREDHARAAVDFARDIVAEMMRDGVPEPRLGIRVGMHTGPVVAGLIGRKRFVYDIWGHTVNYASRLEASGSPGRVQVSLSTLTALGLDPEEMTSRRLDLKGIGVVTAYLLAEDADSP